MMTTITLYGIKNCDTMKKAFRWLDEHGVDYLFHDYKKQGIDENVLSAVIDQHGWEMVINRRGTTWRKLDDATRESMDAPRAIAIAHENPSIIKRPILKHAHGITIGFDPKVYRTLCKRVKFC